VRRRIFIAASVIIVVLATGFFYVRGTPHYSLYMLKRAIEKHNPDEALQYINIDSIVDNLGRDLLAKNEKDTGKETSGGLSLKRMVVDALPGIKDSIRSSMREAIASHGKNKSKADLDNTASNKEVIENRSKRNPRDVPLGKTALRLDKNQLLSIGGITIGDLDVRRIENISLWNLAIQIDGKTAIVSIKDTPNIRARMDKTEAGHWQVVEVLLLP
jgi:hypothetical protein